MAVCFCYVVKSHLFSVHVYNSVLWTQWTGHFLQGTKQEKHSHVYLVGLYNKERMELYYERKRYLKHDGENLRPENNPNTFYGPK